MYVCACLVVRSDYCALVLREGQIRPCFSSHSYAQSRVFCNTGAIAIAPLPIKGWGQKPGSASLPFFGIQPVLLSQDGKVRTGCMRIGTNVRVHEKPARLRNLVSKREREIKYVHLLTKLAFFRPSPPGTYWRYRRPSRH